MHALRVLVCASAIAGFACASVAADAPKSTKSRAPAHSAALPVSLLELMRASIEIPADGIWGAQFADKMTDEDWQLAEQDSINLVVGTSFISRALAGGNAKWLANADWQSWSADLQKTAQAIRLAVKAKDQKAMSPAADHLQEICEGCHAKYSPQTPSDGVARYPFYPKRELAK